MVPLLVEEGESEASGASASVWGPAGTSAIFIVPEPNAANDESPMVAMHEYWPMYVPGLQSASYGTPASFDPRSKVVLHPPMKQARAAQASSRLIFGSVDP